ncbi:MAG: endonuclease/exonuclease/phosphatase family protein [Chloroflexota bacterium]
MTVVQATQATERHLSLRGFIGFLTGVYTLALLLFVILRLIFGDSLWWLAFFGNFTPFYFAVLIALLPLALLVRARRAALLMLPLVLIGLLMFAPPYLPKAQATTQAQAAPTADSFRLITFNVWGDNPDMSRIEDWLKTQQADAVVTIELPPAWANGVPVLKEVYPQQITNHAQGIYWGSTVLSSHPIISTDVFNLGEIPQQRIVIEVGGQQIAIYAIHLYLPVGDKPHIPLQTNFYSNSFLSYDGAKREAQIHTLLDRLKGEPLPYVVAGDFNLSDQAAAYNDLASTMGDSFREVGVGLGTSWPSFQAFGLPAVIPPLVRIDYIWHSDSLRALQAEEGPFLGSDHRPMLATLALAHEGEDVR